MAVKGRVAFWAACALAAAATLAVFLRLPPVARLRLEDPKTTSYIERYVRRSLARGRKPIVMMRWKPLHEISPHLRHAVIVAEDDQFYRHGGVDWEALRQAVRYDLEKGRWVRGGSTITQQVARNLYLSPARTPMRKLKELLLAWRLERELSKYRILELYLNIAEWGPGIYGAQAASQIYFGKDASALDPEEAVALAAALPSPWRLNPSREPGPRLEKRREILLERMRRAGYLPAGVRDAEVELAEAPEPSGRSARPPAAAAPKPARGAGPAGDCGSPPAPAAPDALKPAEAPDGCGPGARARGPFGR